MKKMKENSVITIVGGGAAGFFSAINIKAKNPKARCILIEGTRRILTKVKISGGGRCNVTHNLFDPKSLIKSYPRGEKELLGAFYKFNPEDTIKWFKQRGIELHAEKDGRMFPTSNKSTTIIDCFTKEAAKLGVELKLGQKITEIKKEENGFTLSFLKEEKLHTNKLILATGSSPSGHEFASKLGHKIIDPVPSLFTFNIKHPLFSEMMGQSFEEVSLELSFQKNLKLGKYKQTGPLLITHWGLSGPAVLKLSAFGARDLFKTKYQANLKTNFLSKINSEEALRRLENHKNENLKSLASKSHPFTLTKRFWNKILETQGIKETKTWQEVSKKDLQKVSLALTETLFKIEGKGVFKEEFVTAGGISLKEVNFSSMESKIYPNLYFCGEILNIDGITGGFNFQNAWTGAWLISESLKKE